MFNKVGTLGQPWPLKSGNSQQATFATGGAPIAFQMNDLPDRCPTGPLAYFLPCLLLTLSGTITQAGGGGAAIARDTLVGLLIDSFDWGQAWHGTVLSGDHVKGRHFPVIEFTAGGFQYGSRQFNLIPAADGVYNFSITIALPASDGRGDGVRDTSQLALCYQPSQLKINPAAASVLDASSEGATFSNGTVQVTAVLDPRQELVLGTPPEWILHELSGSSGAAVRINGFGRETRMTGVEDKGGVGFLGELTNVGIQGGAFAAQTVTQFSFPWRGIVQNENVRAYIAMLHEQMPGGVPRTEVAANGTATVSDFSGPPYQQTKLPLASETDGDLTNLRFWPWAIGGERMRLTGLQTADKDQTYYLSCTYDDSVDHLVLAQYFRQWTDQKKAQWLSMVTKDGPGSLAAYVLGDQWLTSELQQRGPRGQHIVTADQRTYLPWQLAPKAR